MGETPNYYIFGTICIFLSLISFFLAKARAYWQIEHNFEKGITKLSRSNIYMYKSYIAFFDHSLAIKIWTVNY